MSWVKIPVPVLQYECVYLVCQATKLSDMYICENRQRTCRKACCRLLTQRLHVFQKDPLPVQACLARGLMHCRCKAGHCH